MLTPPITYDHWIAETTVQGWRSEKDRSALLQAIDQALKVYERAGGAAKADCLHQLWSAYEAWYAHKTRKNPTGPLKSIRNDDNQMQVFEQWLQDEQARLLPAVQGRWGHGPNCYAYAMKCERPAGNGMTPGARAGATATMEGVERDLMAYTHRLFEGIRQDAIANDQTVSFYPPGVETALLRPSPDPMPPVVPRGRYLVAMLVNNGGFHFMRRDPASGLWSHKNRSDGEVETSVERLGAAGRLGPRHCPITNAVAIVMLRNLFPGVQYMPLGGGFVFAGYVLVPDEGIEVAGTMRNYGLE